MSSERMRCIGPLAHGSFAMTSNRGLSEATVDARFCARAYARYSSRASASQRFGPPASRNTSTSTFATSAPSASLA